MISKNKIAELRKLHLKKFRDQFSLFIVEGDKSVKELLCSNYKIVDLIASQEWLAANSNLIPKNLHVHEVIDEVMAQISALKTPQQVLAVTEQKTTSISDIDPDMPLIVLDGIRNPGNFGTIIRSADWFGIKQILLSNDCVELYNPKTIQATMGSFLRVKIIYSFLNEYFSTIKNERQILGAFIDGDDCRKVSYSQNPIVIVGNEANGIRKETFPFIGKKISIKSNNSKAESLNVSVSASILMFEMTKKQIVNLRTV